MVELNEKALEAAEVAWRASVSATCKLMLRDAIRAYLSALPTPDGLEVVAWAQGAALDELAKHKDATATISSGLLPSPFGSPVALVRLSAAQAALQSKDETIARLETGLSELRAEYDAFEQGCRRRDEAFARKMGGLERERDEAREKALKQHGLAETYLNAAVGWERRAEAAEARVNAAVEALQAARGIVATREMIDDSFWGKGHSPATPILKMIDAALNGAKP